VSQNVLKRHGIDNSILGKRQATEIESHFEPLGRRAKMGERFENMEEIFGLDN